MPCGYFKYYQMSQSLIPYSAHAVSVGVWFSEKHGDYLSYSISWQVFITETKYVYCTVWPDARVQSKFNPPDICVGKSGSITASMLYTVLRSTTCFCYQKDIQVKPENLIKRQYSFRNREASDRKEQPFLRKLTAFSGPSLCTSSQNPTFPLPMKNGKLKQSPCSQLAAYKFEQPLYADCVYDSPT